MKFDPIRLRKLNGTRHLLQTCLMSTACKLHLNLIYTPSKSFNDRTDNSAFLVNQSAVNNAQRNTHLNYSSKQTAVRLDLKVTTVQDILHLVKSIYISDFIDSVANDKKLVDTNSQLSLWCSNSLTDQQSIKAIKCADNNLLMIHANDHKFERFEVRDDSTNSVVLKIMKTPTKIPNKHSFSTSQNHEAVALNDSQTLQMLIKQDVLMRELKPLQNQHGDIQLKTSKYLSFLSWLGLNYMGFQFGFLFQLIWITYSWDIMEPVTYFVTFASSMTAFAFVLLARRDPEFSSVIEFIQLRLYHRFVRSSGFPIKRFHMLNSKLFEINNHLMRTNRVQQP